MLESDSLAKLRCGGQGSDEVLTAMKHQGLTGAEAIKAVMQLFGIGLGDAKTLVTSHPSWQAESQATGPFQDDLIRAFRDISSKV